MVKKRLSSSDNVFKFEIPSNSKTSAEAPHSSTDSPSSVFLSPARTNRAGSNVSMLAAREHRRLDAQR